MARRAQCYVSRHGDVLLDATVGESRPGRGLEPDDLMLLYSAGKPLTVVAILQLWEQGKLGLDDRVGEYINDWGAGKERCTIRHVLTHTGGFPNADTKLFDADVPYDEVVATSRRRRRAGSRAPTPTTRRAAGRSSAHRRAGRRSPDRPVPP